jgi:hypothetical protein
MPRRDLAGPLQAVGGLFAMTESTRHAPGSGDEDRQPVRNCRFASAKELTAMTARAFEIDDESAYNEFRSRRLEASTTTPTRYRLDVIASNVADVIQSAGGWLFDRAMFGWDVNVLIAEPSDVRSLQILGIRTVPFELTCQSVTEWTRAPALAVAAEVFNTDARVREIVATALERGLGEVTLWGDTGPTEFHQRVEDVQHRLSAAARAFKAHALTAAALPPRPLTPTEKFRCGSRWCPPYEPDLLPIG